MNKTKRTYVFYLLLTALMVTTCTLEGDIEEVLEKVVIRNNNPNTSGVPYGLTAWAESSSSITISWESYYVFDYNWPGYYEVYRSSSASGSYSQIGTAYTTYYTDTGLSANTTYYYKVSAQTNYGKSSLSSYASARTSSSSSSSNPINLQPNEYEYYDNTISAGEIHTYRFYASSYAYYILQWADRDLGGSYTADILVGVKREGASSYIVDVTDFGNTDNNNFITFYASMSGYYIIEVHGYSSGDYAIGVWQ